MKLMSSFRYTHLKAKKKRKSKAQGGYAARNVTLKNLGYSTYREYLQSDDWKKIRDERLRRFPNCTFCGEKASQVHHFSYHDQVLLGILGALLFPVCESCHCEIELDNGRKRQLRESQDKLIEMLNSRGMERLAKATLAAFGTCVMRSKQVMPAPKKEPWYVGRDEKTVPCGWMKGASIKEISDADLKKLHDNWTINKWTDRPFFKSMKREAKKRGILV